MLVSLRHAVECAYGQDWSGKSRIAVVRDLTSAQITDNPISLARIVNQFLQPTIDLNIIRVGADLFFGSYEQKIEFAIQQTRVLFALVDLRLGQINQLFINSNDTFYVIDDHAEAEALTEDWSFPNKAIDVFFVHAYLGDTVGRSAINGSCDKQSLGEMTGCVIALEHTEEITALALAHEIAHYLGLRHHGDPHNLMHESLPNGGRLETNQAEVMKRHCFVYPECRAR